MYAHWQLDQLDITPITTGTSTFTVADSVSVIFIYTGEIWLSGESGNTAGINVANNMVKIVSADTKVNVNATVAVTTMDTGVEISITIEAVAEGQITSITITIS